jgi:predicted permease
MQLEETLNTTNTAMHPALIALFIMVSLFSFFFIVRRYRTATPEQRRQIVLGGIGAAVIALGIGALLYFR